MSFGKTIYPEMPLVVLVLPEYWFYPESGESSMERFLCQKSRHGNITNAFVNVTLAFLNNTN